jgi:hypothetical protein
MYKGSDPLQLQRVRYAQLTDVMRLNYGSDWGLFH